MEEITRKLSQEELDQASGGFMPSCFHQKVSEYLGQSKIMGGERVYLWKCANCGMEIWVKNEPPKTGGATGGW